MPHAVRMPRDIPLPKVCVCCLADTTHTVQLTDTGKTVGGHAVTGGYVRKVQYQVRDVPCCEACKRTYDNLGRWRAVVVILTLIAGVGILASSKYAHEHHKELLVGFIITVVASAVLAYLVRFAPGYRKRGHAPLCRVGWIDSDGKLALVNQEFVRRLQPQRD